MARLTKEDWQALRDVPILSYLDANGIDYEKDGHNRYKLVEHDSLTINVKRNQFYWNSRDEKGDLGNFIQAYEGLTPGQAIAKWQEFGREYGALSSDTKERYNAAVQPSIKFDWDRLKKSDVIDTAQNYLVNERKLDPQLVKELFDSKVIAQGYPFKDRETGQVMSAPILFPWRNAATGKIEGADRQGTDINFEKFGKRGTEKRVQAGSAEHGGFSITAGTGKDKLIAFESPIDLLSYAQMNYKQLNEDNATLFAVSGTNHKKVNTFMRDMFKANGKVPDKIVIATDNDLAGEQMANRYVNDMSFNNIEVSRIIPVAGKDWNDQLKQGISGETKLTWDQSAAILEGRLASENGEVNLANYGVTGTQHVKESEQVVVTESQDGAASQVEAASDPAWVKQAQQAVKNPTEGTSETETKAKTKQERRLSKQERAEKTRKANQAAIKQSVANIATYKDDPAKVSELIDFIAENGNSYSPRNTLLINGQRPGSTVVKGYEQFKAAGLQVNKGEKGMKIIGAPTKKTTIFDGGQRIPFNQATPEQRSLANQGVLEKKESISYPIHTVFDISQTNAYAPENAHKLPDLMPNKPVDFSTDLSKEQLDAAYGALTDYAKKINVSVTEDDTRLNSLGRPNGAFYPQQNTILIRSDLPDTQKAAVLAHEIGHASLHNTDSKVELTRPQKELQAELTSLVVMKNLGIDTQEHAERYISNWTEGMKNIDDPNGHLLAQVAMASMDVTDHVQQQLHEKLGSSIKMELNDTQVDSRIQHEQQTTKLATTTKQEQTQSRGR